MGIEPATYVLNHNISVVLPCFIPLSQFLLEQLHNYDNGRVTLVRKIQNIELCIPYQILVSTGYEKVQLQVKRLQRACHEKIVLVAWVTHKAGMQRSVCSSSLATVPYSIKNLLTCFYFSSHVQQSIPTVLQPQKWEFASFNLIVLNLICHALISAFKSQRRMEITG